MNKASIFLACYFLHYLIFFILQKLHPLVCQSLRLTCEVPFYSLKLAFSVLDSASDRNVISGTWVAESGCLKRSEDVVLGRRDYSSEGSLGVVVIIEYDASV